MGWHIVEPLKRMLVIWLTLTHKAIHDARHVATHVGVGILIDLSAQEVCCTNRFSNPVSGSCCGMPLIISEVIKWHPLRFGDSFNTVCFIIVSVL